MKVDLDKADLVCLVKGITPNYEPLVKRCGHYVGGFSERWEWNKSQLMELTENELCELYSICKTSYQK